MANEIKLDTVIQDEEMVYEDLTRSWLNGLCVALVKPLVRLGQD